MGLGIAVSTLLQISDLCRHPSIQLHISLIEACRCRVLKKPIDQLGVKLLLEHAACRLFVCTSCDDTLPSQAVELTHANLAYQIRNLSHFLPIRAGNRTLSLLPPWHIYERSSAYYVFSQGSGQVPPPLP